MRLKVAIEDATDQSMEALAQAIHMMIELAVEIEANPNTEILVELCPSVDHAADCAFEPFMIALADRCQSEQDAGSPWDFIAYIAIQNVTIAPQSNPEKKTTLRLLCMSFQNAQGNEWGGFSPIGCQIPEDIKDAIQSSFQAVKKQRTNPNSAASDEESDFIRILAMLICECARQTFYRPPETTLN